MSTLYEINVFIDKVTSIENLVREGDRILTQHGALLNAPAQLYFDDREEEEAIEPQEVWGIEDVIKRLSAWPALGSVDYLLGNTLSLSVGFSRFPTGMVLLGIGFDGKAFRDHPESLPRVVTIVHALHEGFDAIRSSFGWGLTTTSNDEDEEVERLSAGIVVGAPWLDLLRDDVATPEHIEWLNTLRGSQTVLERTSSRGLVWQRDAGPP